MKVVLDTNVLLAALATRGLCEAVMTVCLEGHELILSEGIVAEVHEHLIGKFKTPEAQAREVVAFLREHARMVEPVNVPHDACRDPNDLMVLGTALAGKADCVVTGDADLLSVGKFHRIAILSPRGFYDQLR